MHHALKKVILVVVLIVISCAFSYYLGLRRGEAILDEFVGEFPLSGFNADICESSLRYFFDHNESAAKNNAEAYYVLIHGHNPTTEFLERFHGSSPPVKKGSAYRETDLQILFKIENYESPADGQWLVTIRYREGPLSASTHELLLEKNDGRWTITKDTGISVQ